MIGFHETVEQGKKAAAIKMCLQTYASTGVVWVCDGVILDNELSFRSY